MYNNSNLYIFTLIKYRPLFQFLDPVHVQYQHTNTACCG